MTLHLHALGHFHPENEITNRFLEELDIGTDDAWIVERVGIRRVRDVRLTAVAELDFVAWSAPRTVDQQHGISGPPRRRRVRRSTHPMQSARG